MFQSLVQTHQQLEAEPDVAEPEKENRQREQLTQGQDCVSRNTNISNKSEITIFTIANLKGLGLVRGSGKSSEMTSNWLKLSAAAGNTTKLTLGKALNMKPGYNLVLPLNGSVFPLVKALAGLRKHKCLNGIKIVKFTVNETWKCSPRVFSKDTFALQENICFWGKRENTCSLPQFKADPTSSRGGSKEPESPKSLKTQTPIREFLVWRGHLVT